MRHGSRYPQFISFFGLLLLLAPKIACFQARNPTHSNPDLHLGFGFQAAHNNMPLGLARSVREGVASASPGDQRIRYPQVPLDVEGYPIAPEYLQLEQVHIYIRHGERTPVGVRLAGPPASIPEHWNMCKAARQFRNATTHFQGREIVSTKVVEKKDGTTSEGECLLGELTDLGRQSTFNFGQDLRRLYVDRLGFLPDHLADSRMVYFRSTSMPRTTESLQQIIHGIYPGQKCDSPAALQILIRNGKDENLVGNTSACKRLEILQIGFAKAAAEAYNRTLEHLDEKLAKYLDGNPIRIDGKPRASGILDTIRASTAHGIRVPPEFEEKGVMDVIERAVVSEWLYDKTEEVRRLGIGRLLEDLVTKMQRKVDQRQSQSLKLLVHSTHDTAIAGLCSTLDVFDEKWPAFTASITFELFKRHDPMAQHSFPQTMLSRLRSSAGSGYYVRMRYQNKNMVLPMCASEGSHLRGHPEFCTLSAFRKRVANLIPTNWDEECSLAGHS